MLGVSAGKESHTQSHTSTGTIWLYVMTAVYEEERERSEVYGWCVREVYEEEERERSEVYGWFVWEVYEQEERERNEVHRWCVRE